MGNKQIHVIPHNDGWAVKGAGAQRASSLHPTKSEAFKAGRDSAVSKNAELFVHNMDGKIGYRNSYGNDPCPPRG